MNDAPDNDQWGVEEAEHDEEWESSADSDWRRNARPRDGSIRMRSTTTARNQVTKGTTDKRQSMHLNKAKHAEDWCK